MNNLLIVLSMLITRYKLQKYPVFFLCCLLHIFAPLSHAATASLLEQKVDQAMHPHATLNPEFFIKEQLNPVLAQRFERIGQYYFAMIKETFPNAELVDILFAGSLAGYGYTKDSDVDLHLLVKLGNMPCDKKFIRSYLALLGYKWHHQKMSIGTYPMQITLTLDIDEIGGLYSVLKNKWIHAPQHDQIPYSQEQLRNTVSAYQTKLINTEKAYLQNPSIQNCQNLEKLLSELSAWRRKGLSEGGATSIENVSFRVLRSLGDMDRMKKLIKKCDTQTIDLLLNPVQK